MAYNYYAQSGHCPKTMTVGELIARLQTLPESDPVIFRSPVNGAFGPNTEYSIDSADMVTKVRREELYPASTYIDDETGDLVLNEAHTQVWEHWAGVVVS